VAVTEQFPLFNRFKVEPETEQFPAVELTYVTAPPLVVVEVSGKVFTEVLTVAGSAKVMVWGSLVTSNETLYKSEAKTVSVSLL
jgi:hypothetical protein